MTEKPKPLDLDSWIEEIKEKAERLEKEINDGWKIERSGFFISIPMPKRFLECKEKDWEVARLYGMLRAINEIKQRIRKACEFYLKYKNNPNSLLDDFLEYDEPLDKLREEINREYHYLTDIDIVKIYIEKYNEWLLKEAFKPVFEEVKEND